MERPAEVEAENAQAVAARRKLPPQENALRCGTQPIQNRDELPTDEEAMRNFLLRHRLRFHLFTQILLRRDTFFDTYLRCMSTLLRYLMPKRNRYRSTIFPMASQSVGSSSLF